jgi:hypothetical protein
MQVLSQTEHLEVAEEMLDGAILLLLYLRPELDAVKINPEPASFITRSVNVAKPYIAFTVAPSCSVPLPEVDARVIPHFKAPNHGHGNAGRGIGEKRQPDRAVQSAVRPRRPGSMRLQRRGLAHRAANRWPVPRGNHRAASGLRPAAARRVAPSAPHRLAICGGFWGRRGEERGNAIAVRDAQ